MRVDVKIKLIDGCALMINCEKVSLITAPFGSVCKCVPGLNTLVRYSILGNSRIDGLTFP